MVENTIRQSIYDILERSLCSIIRKHQDSMFWGKRGRGKKGQWAWCKLYFAWIPLPIHKATQQNIAMRIKSYTCESKLKTSTENQVNNKVYRKISSVYQRSLRSRVLPWITVLILLELWWWFGYGETVTHWFAIRDAFSQNKLDWMRDYKAGNSSRSKISSTQGCYKVSQSGCTRILIPGLRTWVWRAMSDFSWPFCGQETECMIFVYEAHSHWSWEEFQGEKKRYCGAQLKHILLIWFACSWMYSGIKTC